MVEAWWLVVAGCGGVGVGMFLFCLMVMAGEEPQDDLVASRVTNAMN
jgi:hypothetical protein